MPIRPLPVLAQFDAAASTARIQVEDVGRVGEYAAAILLVAAADYALRPLGGYALTVVR